MLCQDNYNSSVRRYCVSCLFVLFLPAVGTGALDEYFGTAGLHASVSISSEGFVGFFSKGWEFSVEVGVLIAFYVVFWRKFFPSLAFFC